MTTTGSNGRDSHPSDVELVRALDGELEPQDAEAIERHLESCSECSGKHEQWRRTSDQILQYHDHLPAIHVPEMEGVQVLRRKWGRWSAAGIAAAAALAFTAWLALRPGSPAAPARLVAVNAPTLSAAAVAERPVTALPVATVRQNRLRRGPVQEAVPAVASFIALPFSDRALPLRDATVLRVQLPVEDLWLAGLRVEGGGAGAVVQADVLMGIDGLPRAIRLLP